MTPEVPTASISRNVGQEQRRSAEEAIGKLYRKNTLDIRVIQVISYKLLNVGYEIFKSHAWKSNLLLLGLPMNLSRILLVMEKGCLWDGI